MDAMADATQAAMRQGAYGISTGLIYDPGRFSDTAELVELARAVARHRGFYASHLRGEGDTLIDAVDEAIRIGRAAGVPVHLSHHKAKRRRNWGSVATTLAKVDAAVNSGVDVTLDCYPYTASSTTLWAFLPTWVKQDEFLAHGDQLPTSLRDRVIGDLERMYPGSSVARGAVTDLSDLTISRIARSGAYSRYEGVPLDEAVREAQSNQAEFIVDLLMQVKEVEIIDNAMSEDDMHAVFAHPRCMVGSDAIHFRQDVPGHPHPRNFGTFPRFISRVAPGRMSIETAIHKCTGLPSWRLGMMPERGVLRPGAAADLLMFDPSRFSDNATFRDPKQYSTGLDLAVVNGVIVVSEDTNTGDHAGKILLRGNSHFHDGDS
jgi:N-acyl-D-amino-acid deacylase